MRMPTKKIKAFEDKSGNNVGADVIMLEYRVKKAL